MGSGPGTLIAVGGGEDKSGSMTVLRRALEHAPATRRVAIVPTASSDPVWASELHVSAFQQLGATQVDVLDIRTREHASYEGHVARIHKADLVYMTGGDQARLSTILHGTPVHATMRQKLAAGGVVAGTSAGAAALTRVMIAEGDIVLRKGSVRMTPGLDFLANAVIDTHFAERGRFARLFEAVATHPGLVGLGVGEDTAVVIRGNAAEVVGAGSVVVVDGRELHYSNAHHAEHNQPLDVEHMIVHTYSDGRKFRLGDAARVPLVRRSRARA